jgi:16S rRNA (adenine1518-N6/adenine1519-N6)-dimethyltransferase
MRQRSSLHKRRFGQHFLNSTRIARRIVDCAHVTGKSVIEIGAGKGVMTRLIAARAQHVTAIEIDSALAARLRKEKIPNTVVLQKDFLAVSLAKFRNIIVIGNIPYAISTAIVRKLVSERESVQRIVLTVQKEFAQHLYAEVGATQYGALTLHVGCYFNVTKEFAIPARFFTPSPQVSSVVVVLNRKTPTIRVDDEKFFAFIRSIFRYRRKSVKNALEHSMHCVPHGIEKRILMKRPADLSLAEFHVLYVRMTQR